MQIASASVRVVVKEVTAVHAHSGLKLSRFVLLRVFFKLIGAQVFILTRNAVKIMDQSVGSTMNTLLCIS